MFQFKEIVSRNGYFFNASKIQSFLSTLKRLQNSEFGLSHEIDLAFDDMYG